MSNTISIISLLIACGGLWFTHQQWKKIRAKIVMISDCEKAHDILPSWYTRRMMSDDWLFGLLSVSGNILVINKITGLSDNGEWINVQLALESELSVKIKKDNYIFAISSDRKDASVRVESIVIAFEMQTS